MHHLDRLLTLAKKTHDRLIIHHPETPNDDLVIVPFLDYENLVESSRPDCLDDGLNIYPDDTFNLAEDWNDDLKPVPLVNHENEKVSPEAPLDDEPIFLEEPV